MDIRRAPVRTRGLGLGLGLEIIRVHDLAIRRADGLGFLFAIVRIKGDLSLNSV